MDIVILNGSPKGDYSITVHCMKYIEKRFPDHRFTYVNVAKKIKRIEQNKGYFDTVIDTIEKADGIVWSFPVYVYVVPAQLKRFIECINQAKRKNVFREKYGTAFTTSVHFFDHTAHNYIHGISEDLHMHYVDGYSADMGDLLKPKERQRMLTFARGFFDHIRNHLPTERKFSPISYKRSSYTPDPISDQPKTKNKKIVMMTDAEENDTNLQNMITHFTASLPNPVKIINIHDIDMRGGCRGCIRCGYDGTCFYNDDYMNMFNQNILTADGLVFAGKIVDRYLTSRWKMFTDRMFFNGHRPVLENKQFAYLISGPLRQIPNLRQMLESITQVGRGNLVGIVTDEYDESDTLTSLIENLGYKLMWALDNSVRKPSTYLGVGGHKIFRDMIYENSAVLVEDHRFYEKHDLYDFPQKNLKKRGINLFMKGLLTIPQVRKKAYLDIPKYMVEPLRKVINEEDKPDPKNLDLVKHWITRLVK